jgi:hypothetical protein
MERWEGAGGWTNGLTFWKESVTQLKKKSNINKHEPHE